MLCRWDQLKKPLGDKATFKIETKKSAKSKKALNFEKLGSHTSEFNNPQVISVCENKIHVAIGYGLANVIVLEGNIGYEEFGRDIFLTGSNNQFRNYEFWISDDLFNQLNCFWQKKRNDETRLKNYLGSYIWS